MATFEKDLIDKQTAANKAIQVLSDAFGAKDSLFLKGSIFGETAATLDELAEATHEVRVTPRVITVNN